MTDIIWHRCSMCGELWAGSHQCVPIQIKPFQAVTEHQYSRSEVGAVISVAETAMAKIDKLRAALREIATALDSPYNADHRIGQIRAIVERAVGGES